MPVFKKHFNFSIMSIVTGRSFPKKFFSIRFSMYNFPLNRFPLPECLYISIYISKFLFFGLFSISRLYLIFYPYSERRFGFYGKFYTGYSVLKFFFIFLLELIKIEKVTENDLKFCIKNRLFLRFFRFNLYRTQNFFKKFSSPV